jgi:iron complex outermembrane receptor protein
MFTKKDSIAITLSILASYSIMANAQETAMVKIANVDVIEKNQVTQNIKQELARIPGGTNIVNLESITTSKATLGEILKTEPGIMIQEFFGGNDQPRLNVRGSGIQSNPVNNGVNLLYDGTSINQADGSFVIGLLNPAQHSAVSVYRGSNAMKHGSASLGGAINFTSKTGINSDSFVEMQSGSHNTQNINMGVGGVNNKFDYYISSGYAKSDGFRAVNTSERKDFSINLGYQVSDIIENRTQINYSDNFFDIPFVLPKDVAKDHPESVVGDGYSGAWDGKLNIRDRKPHRDTKQLRFSNKTIFRVNDSMEHQVALFAEKLDDTFTDPLAHAITESKNVGINLSTNGSNALVNNDKYDISFAFNKGSMPVEYWVNSSIDGSKLFKFADLDQEADNLAVNLQYNIPISKSTEIVADLQYIKNTREISGKASTLPIPGDTVIANINKKYSYDALNPKFGLIYKLSDQSNIYANVSRSMEAPTFNQLVYRKASPMANAGNAAMVSGAELVDLNQQEATTFEVGTKGDWKDTSWQLSYYYSKIKDELITQVDASAVNGSTFNYTDKTTHQGIEFGFNQILTKGFFDSTDTISTNIVYNYNDFTFDGGEYAGNQIAGVPKQTVYLELAYNLGDIFFIAPNIKLQPNDNYADHSNSMKQDSFSLIGLKLSYKPKANLTLYTNLNNLTNEVYESTYVVRGKSDEGTPTFLPGDGFNYTFGIKYSF